MAKEKISEIEDMVKETTGNKTRSFSDADKVNFLIHETGLPEREEWRIKNV